MTIVGADNFVKHIKAHAVENPDVTERGILLFLHCLLPMLKPKI